MWFNKLAQNYKGHPANKTNNPEDRGFKFTFKHINAIFEHNCTISTLFINRQQVLVCVDNK